GTAQSEGSQLETATPVPPTHTTAIEPTPTATATPPAENLEVANSQAATPSAETQPAPVETKPWTWSVAAAHITDSTVHVLGREAPLAVSLGLDASDLTGDANYPARVGLALKLGDGAVNIDGALRLHGLGFAGTIRTAGLSVPEIIVSSTTLPTDLLRSGHLSTELTVEAGMALPDGAALAPRDARVH